MSCDDDRPVSDIVGARVILVRCSVLAVVLGAAGQESGRGILGNG
jgi:hypothetical protein